MVLLNSSRRRMASPDRSDEEIGDGMDVDEAGEGDQFFC